MQTGNLGNIALKLDGAAWSAGTAYPALTVLRHNGAAWGAVRDTIAGEEPGVSAAWLAMSFDFSAPGLVGAFAMNMPPTGWLECDGSALNRNAYSGLFAAVGTVFGAGNGSSTFNIPDLRGEFPRGWDHGRGVDGNRSFGSRQGDASRKFTADSIVGSLTGYGEPFDMTSGVSRVHSLNPDVALSFPGGGGTTLRFFIWDLDASRQLPTAAENRPRNVALMYCIKY